MNNRRNYYRILHVQPEAPDEIIKASYRSLMTKLKMHPDLGGDTQMAALINQAYAVLSDPQRRKKYDESLRQVNAPAYARSGFGANKSDGDSSSRGGFNSYWQASQQSRKESSFKTGQCVFCRSIQPMPLPKFCPDCASPLSPNPFVGKKRACDPVGRRGSPRIGKEGAITLYPSWPHPGHPSQIRDLSTTGLSLLSPHKAQSGDIIKLDANFVKGIAKVVTVRPFGKNYAIHAVFLTTEFMTKTGTFVAEKA